MDEIKLWAVEGPTQVADITPTDRLASESFFEEILVNNPEMLMPGLTLVGRQTPTEGGPLDLLGVDSDGRLVVFELKRDRLSRDAVAQIIDYASCLEDMALDDLVNHISDKSGTHGIEEIDEFEKWYTENSDADSLDALRPLRMFLVGLGFDDKTKRMVSFLEAKGLDISLLTFYSFEQDGKILLARHLCVEDDNDDSQQSRRSQRSQEEFKDLLRTRVNRHGVSDLFDAVTGMFRENWPSSLERCNGLGHIFCLQKRGGTRRRIQYARIDPGKKVLVVFFSNAIELCMDKFKPLIKEIPFQTYPKNRKDDALNDLADALKDNLEIQFLLNKADWETHKEKLNELTRAVYNAQQNSMQGN